MSGRIVVVTGGSSGIGAAAVAAFLGAGDDVISVARRPCPIGGARSVALDLGADDLEVQAGAALVPLVARAGRPLVVVHNAAVLERDTATDLVAAQLSRTLRVNVVAPALLNRALAPHLSPGSCILYVGSTLSEKAVAGLASYVTSKHAVVGLMRATCQDLQGKRVHTACVCPGFTDTEMLRARAGDAAVLASLASLSTFGRLVEPAEIARVLLFCADNPALNGAVVHANLGQIER